MPDRPGPNATAFRLTLHCVDGQPRVFPVFADAAFDNAERATRWPDPPFSPAILDQLGDRDVLFGSIVRVYTHMIRNGEGTLYFTDDAGHEWGIPARSVVAVELHDPEAPGRGSRRKIGFGLPGEDVPVNVVSIEAERARRS